MNMIVFTIYLLFGVLRDVRAITITGTTSSSNVSGTYIPTIIQQNCYDQAIAVTSSEFLLVHLNYSIVKLDTIQYPFRVSGANVSLQALYYDLEEFPADLAYIEEFYPSVQDHGFDALVLRVINGDFSFYSWGALRFWKKRDCAVPTFIILDDSLTKAMKNNSLVYAKLDFEENHVITFIKSPAYIIGVTLPSILVAIALFVVSAFKLYRTGFPFIRNTGTLLCLLGVASSIVMCKKTQLSLVFS
jgi:hypothetical protein